jgi:hypothetical protein
LTTNDGKDRGEQLWYYTTSEQSAFLGYDNSAGKLIAASNVSIANEIVTVNNYGTFVVGTLEGTTVSATGNITGDYVIGNGSQLTSLNGSNVVGSVGNSNYAVTTDVANVVSGNNQANITSVGTLVSLSVTGNVNSGNLVTVGNVSGNYILGNGSQLTGLAPIYNDSNVSTYLNGQITSNIIPNGNSTQSLGNATNQWKSLYVSNSTIYIASTPITVSNGTLQVNGANVLTGNAGAAFSTSGNISGGNISATGNIAGSYIIGNGSQLTGLAANYGNADVAGYLTIYTGNLSANVISATGNITGSYIIGNGSQLTGLPATYGNAEVSNYLASGTDTANIVTTGNINGGNINGTKVVATTLTGTLSTGAQTNISLVGTLSSLSVTGNVQGGNFNTIGAISASGNVVAGNVNTAGSISASGDITGRNLNSSNADLAEMYCADATYVPGTVVEFGGEYEITISTKSHSTRVAGIISTAPSYLMNSTLDCINSLELALVGRVPCRVVGVIHKGDRLVTSEIPGVATALDPLLYQPGCIVGKALESYDSPIDGIIEVAVGRA